MITALLLQGSRFKENYSYFHSVNYSIIHFSNNKLSAPKSFPVNRSQCINKRYVQPKKNITLYAVVDAILL